MNIKIPENWGKEPVSHFIKSAYENSISAFTEYKKTPIFKALYEVNNLFNLAGNVKYEPDERLLTNFLGRCYTAYLGGIRLSTSGQVVEAYMVIRGCLENALYALYINDDPTKDTDLPERSVVWINRGKDKASTKKCRKIFTYTAVKDNLINQDKALGQEASLLYERTIDYGAHPSFYGHSTTSRIKEDGVTIQLLLPRTPAFKLCIQTNVEAGICCLRIFNRIFQDTFHSIGITKRLNKIDWKGKQEKK